MPTSIKTILEIEDKPLRQSLDNIKKYYQETYSNWANETKKVNEADKELIRSKQELADTAGILKASTLESKEAYSKLSKETKELVKEQKNLKKATDDNRASAQDAISTRLKTIAGIQQEITSAEALVKKNTDNVEKIKYAISTQKNLRAELEQTLKARINEANELKEHTIATEKLAIAQKAQLIVNQELAKAQFQQKTSTPTSKQSWDTSDMKNYYSSLEKESLQATLATEKLTASQKIEREQATEAYQRLYVNSKATNTYADAVRRLTNAKNIGAIDQKQYNIGLDKEKENLKEAELATKKHHGTLESGTNSIVRHWRQLETLALMLYTVKTAYDATLGTGLKTAAAFEQMQIGIASLIASSSQDVTSMGQHVTASEKFTLAQRDAADAVLQLRKANIDTPATLKQLTVGFQSALGPALQLGFSVKQTVEYSRLMTIAASALTVPMEQISQEMRSILNGTIDQNSIVANSLRITNAQMKAHEKLGDSYQFLMSKLEDFNAAGKVINQSWDGIISNLTDNWQAFTADVVTNSGMFQDLKKVFTDLSNGIHTNSKEITEDFDSLYKSIKLIEIPFSMIKTTGKEVSEVLDMISISTKETMKIFGVDENITTFTASILGLSVVLQTIEAGLKNFGTVASSFTISSSGIGFDLEKANKEIITIGDLGKSYEEAYNKITKAKKQTSTVGQDTKEIKDIKEKIEQPKEQGKLVANIKTDEKFLIEANKEIEKSLGKQSEYEKQIEKAKSEIVQYEKKIAVAKQSGTKDTDAEKAVITLNTLIKSDMKEISEIKQKDNEKNQKALEDEVDKRYKILKAQKTSRDIVEAIALEESKWQKGRGLTQLDILNQEVQSKYEEYEILKQSGAKKDDINKAELEYKKVVTAIDEYSDKQDKDREKEKLDAQKENLAWTLKIYDEQRKYSDELLALQSEMYGVGKKNDIELWYQTQLEGLGKLQINSEEAANQLMGVIDKINKIKDLKITQQTLAFKVEDTFFTSFENNLASAIDGAFNNQDFNFETFFKSIQKDLTQTISKSLATDITGAIRGNSPMDLLTVSKSLFSGGSSITDLSSLNDYITQNSSNLTIDQIDSAYQSADEGNFSGASDILGATSNLKTMYNALSSGIGSTVYSPFGYASSGLNSLGLTSAGAGVADFGAGVTSIFTGGADFAGASAMGAGQIIGGAGAGYAVGTIGDAILGTKTQAGAGGAIGAAIGTAILPGVGTAIGAVLGSLAGGAFGSTKEVEKGLYFNKDTSSLSGMDTVQSYRDTETKSWFSGSGDSSYEQITDAQKRSIEGIFKSYDYLLSQLGSTKHIVLEASRYTAETFQDEIAKGFIATFTGIQQHASEYLYSRNGMVYTKYNDTQEMTKVYNMWVDYSKSVNKTVTEAMNESVSQFINTQRSFELWSLGDSMEALAKKAEFAKSDFEALSSSIGANGVTVQNYLQKYDEAVKTSFTPETISNWKNLGSALISAEDASKALSTATKTLIDQQYQVALAIQTQSGLNTKAFIDSFRTQSQLVADMASTLGVTTATTYDQLTSLFDSLGNDIDGLTNAELQFLNANKALIDTDLTNKLSSITSGISSLNSVVDSLAGVIDKLKGSALGSTYSMQKYYDSMKQSLSLSGSSDIASFQSSLNDTIAASSVLFESSNFTATRDQQFAQLVAANQFDSMKTTALTQIDYLKLIEINTREQIAAILSLITALGQKIDANLIKSQNPLAINNEGWTPGINGVSTWTSTGGAVATQQPNVSDFTIRTKDAQLISSTDAINYVNTQLAANNPLSVYQAAINTGISANSLDALMGWESGTSNTWASANNLNSFSVGGYTGDAPINKISGFVHGQEFVANAPTTKALGLNKDNGGIFREILEENKSLRNEIISLRKEMLANNNYLDRIEQNTHTSKWA